MPEFLPRKSHGQSSLAGCSPWGCKESDTTKQLSTHALAFYVNVIYFRYFLWVLLSGKKYIFIYILLQWWWSPYNKKIAKDSNLNSTKVYLCFKCCCCLVAKSFLTLCDPIDCNPPGSSIHRISQARILEWVALPFSRGSPWIRDQTSLLHWQADSLQLSPQGSPCFI